MPETWQSPSKKPREAPPLAGKDRVRGVVYLVLTTASEWIIILALVAAIVYLAFGTDLGKSVGVER